MAKFLSLIFKNLRRNKVRTLLTGLAVVVLVFIQTAATAVTSKVNQMVHGGKNANKLLVTERWVMPGSMPLRYIPEISRTPGVKDWTVWHYYGGCYDESMQDDRLGLGIATRPENLASMHSELKDVDPEAFERLKKERTGAIVGGAVLDMMHWEVGQEFTFVSTTHEYHNLRFKIVGRIPSGIWSRSFFFREDYFQEGTGDKDSANVVLLQVGDSAATQQVIQRIMQRFENRQPELNVETEAANVARLAGRTEAVLAIIKFVAIVLAIDMVIILANSISIATRERRVEIAVLKMLGFQPRHILTLVVGEAMLVGALSGFVGTLAAWGFSRMTTDGMLPSTALNGFLATFPVSPVAMIWGPLLGMAIGIAGSFLPAWNTRRVNVTDVFARIA